MSNKLDKFFKEFNFSDVGKIIKNGKIGVEKESLRMSQSTISKKKHHQKLGSALCNKYITTDFSEALIELITPPYTNKLDGLSFLDNLHHFVSKNIEDETLWPLSMPPRITSGDAIPIAQYGSSNLSLFKTIYRNGLAHRYGRAMQAIAGIHINYSLPEEIWEKLFPQSTDLDLQENKSITYFRTIRNLQRLNWLTLYFFGASPIASKNYINKNIDGFKKLYGDYYLPYATSLRMSKIGYQNINQSNLRISLDSLSDYIEGLKDAIGTESKEFEKIFKMSKEDRPQINANILQIEDEYYAISRPKSSVLSDISLVSKLLNHGIDYLEFRSLDLNPFSRNGIDSDAIYFLEALFIYCTFTSSPVLTKEEINEIRNNDHLVATRGRESGLKLRRNNKDVLLIDWANQILDEMTPIAELLGKFDAIIKDKKEVINEPEKTLSGKLLSSYIDQKINYQDLGLSFSEDYKHQYTSKEKSINTDWNLLETEAVDSLLRQNRLEESQSESYDAFVENYFNS